MLGFLFRVLVSLWILLRIMVSWDWSNVGPSLVVELAGAGIVYIIVDRLVKERERRRDLIVEMGSRVNDVAVKAAEKLNKMGTLRDGSLREANLWRANLKGACLVDADLRKALLWDANLKQVDLAGAKLQRTYLRDADLEGATLWDAKLQGANLRDANLRCAKLANTLFDGNSVLPDGEKWTPETDMERFIDPEHPDFWRPSWVAKKESFENEAEDDRESTAR
jgi:hypothetical protein